MTQEYIIYIILGKIIDAVMFLSEQHKHLILKLRTLQFKIHKYDSGIWKN